MSRSSQVKVKSEVLLSHVDETNAVDLSFLSCLGKARKQCVGLWKKKVSSLSLLLATLSFRVFSFPELSNIDSSSHTLRTIESRKARDGRRALIMSERRKDVACYIILCYVTLYYIILYYIIFTGYERRRRKKAMRKEGREREREKGKEA